MFGINKNAKRRNQILKDIREREDKENISIVGFGSTSDQKETSLMLRTQKENTKTMEKKREERENKEKSIDDLKFVLDGAELQCILCTNPQGILKVIFDTPSIQGKKIATEVEKSKKSIIFTGNCKKSPHSAAPCLAVRNVCSWKNIGTMRYQDKLPLLLKSTIKCNYGATDIVITDCGQIDIPGGINTDGMPLPKQKNKIY